MSSEELTELNAQSQKAPTVKLRSRSAPARPLAGRRCVTTNRRMVHSKTASRAQLTSRSGRSNYPRSYTGNSKAQQKPSLVSTSIVRAPGYTLTRTPTAVSMDINTAKFFGEQEFEQPSEIPRSKAASFISSTSSVKKVSSPTVSMVMRSPVFEQLQKEKAALDIQVAELNIRIEDLKETHEEEIRKREEKFGELTEALAKQYKSELSELEDHHQQELCNMQDYQDELAETMSKKQDEEKAQFEEKIGEVHQRLKDVLASKEKELADLEYELKEKHDEYIASLMEEHRSEVRTRVAETRSELSKERQQKIEELALEHQMEMDEMQHKVNEAMALKEDLQKAQKKNKKLEKEVSKQKDKVRVLRQQQIETETSLQETMMKLQELQENFQDKVSDVKSSYRDRVDNLMRENTLLRRRLLSKTDQFSEYRSNTEKLQADKIKSTKEKVQIVLRARQRATLSVAMGTHESEPLGSAVPSRPMSAPVTRGEKSGAKQKTDIPFSVNQL